MKKELLVIEDINLLDVNSEEVINCLIENDNREMDYLEIVESIGEITEVN